ncbi:DUF2721 domain-containing protein [Bradyrhizobium sp. DASA03120]|uniref:DUF2721 domain-containing protein n=1 Tax=Bradyrhizobium sp. SMVTL-02 TaxID=3395917 RepID=UPI003F72E0D4
MGAIVTSLLVIVAFVSAFFQFQHEYGVAILFIVALSFFTLSLIDLVREVRIALHEIGRYKQDQGPHRSPCPGRHGNLPAHITQNGAALNCTSMAGLVFAEEPDLDRCLSTRDRLFPERRGDSVRPEACRRPDADRTVHRSSGAGPTRA